MARIWRSSSVMNQLLVRCGWVEGCISLLIGSPERSRSDFKLMSCG